MLGPESPPARVAQAAGGGRLPLRARQGFVGISPVPGANEAYKQVFFHKDSNRTTAGAFIPQPWAILIIPPEATNTGPGFNRGSGGGAQGCGFEALVGEYVLTEGGISYSPRLCFSVCVCVSVCRH